MTEFDAPSANVPQNDRMDSRLADVLAQTDRAALGGRLRSARQARGLTQGEVAGEVMSVAYLSRIESGSRQPTAPALDALAERLGVSVESLLGVAERREVDEMRLALDYAELSLESGQPEDAEEHLRKALALLETDADGRRHARRGHACCTRGHWRRPSSRTTPSSSSSHSSTTRPSTV